MAAPSFLSAKQRASTRQEIAARDGTGARHAASSTGFTGNITIDTNALDRDGSASDLLIERQLELQLSRKVNIVLPQRVRREARQPNTVLTFAKRSIRKILTSPTELTGQELQLRRRVELWSSRQCQAGQTYFLPVISLKPGTTVAYVVTNDERILDKTSELADLLPPC